MPLAVEPPPAAAVEMLPSAFRLTVTMQVWPLALVPCFVTVSACAAAPVNEQATAASTQVIMGFIGASPQM